MTAPVNKSAEHATVQATRDASNQANARPVPGGTGSSGSSISATPAPDYYYITSSPSQGLGVYVSCDQAQTALNAMSPAAQEAIAQAIKDIQYERLSVE